MSLPNPGMDFTAFDNLPAASLDDLVENIEALADGSGLNTGDASNGVSNTNLKTGAGQPGGAWDSWTPTWTNLTVGNSVVTAKYKQIGKTIHCRVHVLYGTTGSSTASVVTLTLPVTANSEYASKNIPSGVMRQSDTGTANYTGYVRIESTTTAALIRYSASGANVGEAALIAMGNTDILEFSFTYEAA